MAHRPAQVLVGLIVLAGLITRVVLIHSSIGVLDSDEATVGLMARHFLHGQFRAFFWGQNYGGTIETFFTAVLFRIFGASTGALKAVPLLFNAAAAVLVWRVARRVMAARPAVAAGLLMWIWPANYIWWSVKARGFYEATLCITLGCALLILRIAQDEESARYPDWVALGALIGLGWWQTPQVVYIVAPAGLWLLVTHRGALRHAWAAAPAAVIGALPWLWANVGSGFKSLTSPPAPIKAGYGAHLLTFMRTGLPMTLGLKYVYLTAWIGSRHIVEVLYAVGAAVIVIGVMRQQRGSLLLGVVILAYPLIHSVLNLSSEVAEGRYTLFLLPWLAIALVRACVRPAAMIALIVIVASVSWVGLQDLRGQTSPYAPDRRVPTSMADLEAALEDHAITRVWANYWVAYRLTFETREKVIAASAAVRRDPQYNVDVEKAAAPAYVFLSGSADVRRFHGYLRLHRIDYIEDVVGRSWVIDIPALPVTPMQVHTLTV